MPLLRSYLAWRVIKRMSQIDLMRKYPIDVQYETFRKLISTAKNTIFGKEYDFASIKTIQEFQKRIPLQSYEDMVHYVERLRKGEQNLLWPSEVKWFAKSSGTTDAKSKFIPVSKEAMEDCYMGRTPSHPQSRFNRPTDGGDVRREDGDSEAVELPCVGALQALPNPANEHFLEAHKRRRND